MKDKTKQAFFQYKPVRNGKMSNISKIEYEKLKLQQDKCFKQKRFLIKALVYFSPASYQDHISFFHEQYIVYHCS